jgi:hypothetical protein
VRRIGEVPAATGLTVRTLHDYDQIGARLDRDRADPGTVLRAHSTGWAERWPP